MATDQQIPDEAVRAYGRAYDLASIDAQYASDEHLGEDLARVERNAIRAGLAAADTILAEQWRRQERDRLLERLRLRRRAAADTMSVDPRAEQQSYSEGQIAAYDELIEVLCRD